MTVWAGLQVKQINFVVDVYNMDRMHVAKKTKIILILSVVCIGLLICFLVLLINSKIKVISESEKRSVSTITFCLKNYIAENEGCFPTSVEDLEKKGFLKKVPYGNKQGEYYYRIYAPDMTAWEGWLPFQQFNQFTFQYGVKVEDIELKEGRLFSKADHTQIFLFKGPFFERLITEYEAASLELYQEMVRLQKKTKQNSFNPNPKNQL